MTSGVSTSAATAPVATLPPVTQPSPTPTPQGGFANQSAVAQDAASLAFLASTIQPWVAQPSLNQIEQVGGSILTYSTGLASPSLVAAAGSQDLWVVSSGNDELVHLQQGQTGLGQVALSPIPAHPVALAADSSQAWEADSSGTLTYMATSGGATGSVSLGSGVTPTAIALDSSYAWVTAGSNSLYRITPSPLAVSSPITVGSNPVAVAEDTSGNIWTVGTGGVTYVSGGTAQATVQLPSGSGTPTAIAYDSTDSDIWIALKGPNEVAWFSPSQVASNPSAPAIATASLPVSPAAMAIDAQGNVWLADPTSGQVAEVWGQ